MDLPISVIVPVYNAGCFLPSCIESILAQTFGNFELLLIDDGSTDASLDICTRYAKTDTRITLFHKENEGVTATRKYGVERAKGEYICFVDADDVIPENALSSLYSKCEDADIVVGAYKEINKRTKSAHFIDTRIPSLIDGLTFTRLQLDNKLFHAPWGKMIRKSCLGNDIFDIPRSIFRGEDFIMNVRLGLKVKKVKIIKEIIYCYIIRETSCMLSCKPSLEYEKLFDSYLTASFCDKQLYASLESSVLHQRIEAISGLILAKCELNINDEFVQTVYQASRMKPLNVSQILIKLFLFQPSLYRFLYKTAKKLNVT